MDTQIRILLVEDSPSDAELLKEMLHASGVGPFEICWAECLGDALAHLNEQSFDVLLLDLSLPDSSGSETFLRAKQAAPDLPTVLLTGQHNEQLGLEAVQQGIQDYLIKGEADGRQIARAIRYAMERKSAERALRDSEERLRQVQKMESIGLLAGGIAHDFNNLLVGVIGNASLAEEMLPDGSSVKPILGNIIKAGEQAAHLTRQMLAYAGKGEFIIQPVNLSSIVRDASTLVQGSISRRITVNLRLQSSIPLVEADPSQIQQIFMNLVLNAGEAIGDAPGVISIRTGRVEIGAAYVEERLATWPIQPGHFVYLEVQDTGCGMEEVTKAKIFDPFYTTKFQGRGLGLAAVTGIVRRCRGAVEVTTAPRFGSTFRVLLPSMAVNTTQPVNQFELQDELRGNGAILVVDDERVVRDTAKHALERQGYEVFTAESGPAAIRLVEQHGRRFRIVLLDLSMPGMVGSEALAEFRKIRPDLKVLVSSGYPEAETLKAFGIVEISGFIQKPYTAGQLAKLIAAALAEVQ